MNDNRGNNGMIAGFILGSLVGAGVALLVAPATGADVRRRLGRTAQDFGDRARSLASNAGHDLRDGVEDAKNRIQDVKDRVTHGVHEVRKDVKDAYDAGRTAARS